MSKSKRSTNHGDLVCDGKRTGRGPRWLRQVNWAYRPWQSGANIVPRTSKLSSAEPTEKNVPARYSSARRATAWGVHVLTAMGTLCCLQSLEATFASEWRAALTWLMVAVIIDAVDGTVARLVGVKQVLPDFDGALLDNLVDFVNYVIVPALFIHRAELLPAPASFGAISAICLASAYQFCQNHAKTPDHFFKGFPSYWNVVALYLMTLGLSPAVNLVIVLTLVVLVFVPVKYIYVTRTVEYRHLTLPLTFVWTCMAVAMLWQLPAAPRWLVWSSLLYVAYYTVMSLRLTFAGARR